MNHTQTSRPRASSSVGGGTESQKNEGCHSPFPLEPLPLFLQVESGIPSSEALKGIVD